MNTESLGSILEKMRRCSLSPVDLLIDLMDRIEKYDKDIQSYVSLNEGAMKHAEKAEKQYNNGEATGLLEGVPLSVKDLMDTADLITTYGNAYFGSNVPERNATIVQNLLKSGSYIIGKTNTHEFGLGSRTEPTKNPYNIQRIPGGSSGGSAAALASNMALLATGSDTGGSIRIPAAMCGVTGFKPSFGALSTAGVFPESWSMDQVGPMLRFASDLPLVMEAMGKKIHIPYTLKNNRIATLEEAMDTGHSGIDSVINRALDILNKRCKLEIISIRGGDTLKNCRKFHQIIDTTELAAIHENMYNEKKSIYTRSSIEQIEAGMNVRATEYAHAIHEKDALYRKMLLEMKGVDAFVMPTLPYIAPLIDGEDVGEHNGHAYQEEFNYLGMPAISVPCGFYRKMPIGIQFCFQKRG
jgi:Asp-tRNAAsn/Glu-tRNAGln amidotransferase A subunit and related amidases